jgi:hypothetical protein
MEISITNPKLVSSCWVNTVVCVINPGPMADVAIRNAAPSKTDLDDDVRIFYYKGI